jgi:hypothetical protein
MTRAPNDHERSSFDSTANQSSLNVRASTLFQQVHSQGVQTLNSTMSISRTLVILSNMWTHEEPQYIQPFYTKRSSYTSAATQSLLVKTFQVGTGEHARCLPAPVLHLIDMTSTQLKCLKTSIAQNLKRVTAANSSLEACIRLDGQEASTPDVLNRHNLRLSKRFARVCLSIVLPDWHALP